MNEEYYLLTDGEQTGPFSLEQVTRMTRDGRIHESTLWSKAGFPDWKSLKSLPDAGQLPPPAPNPEGKIYLSRAGNRTGPFALSQIRTMWQSGLITMDTLVWHEGMTGWVAAAKFFADTGPGSVAPLMLPSSRSRGIYIVLALILGCLGIHNFYAGYYGRGIAQFLITLFLGWIFLGIIITGIWSIMEAICVTHDAAGMPMN